MALERRAVFDKTITAELYRHIRKLHVTNPSAQFCLPPSPFLQGLGSLNAISYQGDPEESFIYGLNYSLPLLPMQKITNLQITDCEFTRQDVSDIFTLKSLACLCLERCSCPSAPDDDGTPGSAPSPPAPIVDLTLRSSTELLALKTFEVLPSVRRLCLHGIAEYLAMEFRRIETPALQFLDISCDPLGCILHPTWTMFRKISIPATLRLHIFSIAGIGGILSAERWFFHTSPDDYLALEAQDMRTLQIILYNQPPRQLLARLQMLLGSTPELAISVYLREEIQNSDEYMALGVSFRRHEEM